MNKINKMTGYDLWKMEQDRKYNLWKIAGKTPIKSEEQLNYLWDIEEDNNETFAEIEERNVWF